MEGPNTIKKEVQDVLTQHQLPFTIFNTGLFAEYVAPFLNYNYSEGYMNVVGKGEMAFNITPRAEVGRFVAHVLSTAQKSDLQGARIPF
ncbi:unnamed protein product [Phytophthora lilii]|uniref:Unnamed protein product n=1 Tax=Phytophthora lilii TaxID=2077276 RepID=A0A9W6U6X5_9STRA|nr:unnamed protein product [Phytophthora lilii]